ncbi:MAG: conjugal transfer protein TraX [Oscillospiraceae bacterium]|jgi:hypothetical protein|nr:conjugal transfer protein TraX [Oscillospiraceae bacterium]
MKLSSYQLKLIAIVSMLIDHTAKIVFSSQTTLLLLFPGQLALTYWIIQVMTWIGRIAFVLFAFMIAEGSLKTRNLPKYVLRLAVFALISQPFYYLAFAGGGFEGLESIKLALMFILKPNNIFVVLALGALTIYVQQKLQASGTKRLRWLIVPVFALTCFVASFLRTGYDGWGVALIFGFYLAHDLKRKAVWALVWSAVFYGLYAVWNGVTFAWIPQHDVAVWRQVQQVLTGFAQFIAASLCVPLILSYSGQRGRRSKWFFYAFYPAHLLILYVAAVNLTKVS